MPSDGYPGNVTNKHFSTAFLQRCLRSPACWGIALVQAVLWLVARLPIRVYPLLAHGLGRLFRVFGARRRHIAEVNLQLCFPEKNRDELINLRNKHFTALGYGVIEAALGWWAHPTRLRRLGKVHGLEHLQRVQAAGRGAILLGAHYTTLEIGGTILGLVSPIPVRPTFRPHENAWLDYIVNRRRGVFLGPPIARDNIREMVRALRRQEIVWFAFDQNYGLKHSVFSPFFNVPAATNTALSRIVALTHAAVLPYSSRRLDDGTYEIVIKPPLEDFPSADPQADTDRMNHIIETQVRIAPEQYWWIHRRFKDRPPGQKDVYAPAD